MATSAPPKDRAIREPAAKYFGRAQASAKDLTIHVIGFGAANGKSAGARCLADATNGRQVVARDTAELTTALRQPLVCPQLSETAVKESIDRSRSR